MSDASPLPDTLLSHYRIVGRVGQGGMGVLYRARDTRLDRTVALKLLRGVGGLDDDQRRRFLQEARAASALNHPNIVTIYDIDREPGPDGAYFIAMEYLDGEPLSRIMTGRRLDLDEMLRYAIPAAAGLGAAHAAGIVHRDVKPANVMVTASGSVKVLDFGLAKLSPTSAGWTADELAGSPTATAGPHTAAGVILGTPAYMSPEQAQGQRLDARSDVFSLGVILYEMLAGRRPFTSDNYVGLLSAIVREEPPPLSSLRHDVPPELDRIVQRCLAKDRQARYADAGEVRRALEDVRARRLPSRAPLAPLRRPAIAVPLALLAVAAAVAGVLAWRRSAAERHARNTVLPEIERLAVNAEGAVRAYRLIQEVRPVLRNDPRLEELWRSATWPATFDSTPTGARAFYKGYLTPDEPWQLLGHTPFKGTPVPAAQLRWRFEKEGYEPAEMAFMALVPPGAVELPATGIAPAGMVRVAAGRATGSRMNPVSVPGFWLDRYEVTNAEYKKFVGAGGYRRREIWTHPFVDGRRTLTFAEAVARFVDLTGRPGPATWKLGSFPEGKENLPVTGVSWYEAAAYAAFAGKSLPTVHHWRRAAGFGIFSEILHFANFSGEGPHAIGAHGAMSPFGTYDMAGNVREWCVNDVGGRRFIMGGAWSDPVYRFVGGESLPPFDRDALNGFRLAKYDQPPTSEMTGAVVAQVRDYTKESPAPDAIYKAYARQYDYDALPLEPTVERVEDGSDAWRREKVTVRAAYGGETLPIHLFLPRNARPPYQPILFFPPGSAVFLHSSEQLGSREFGFLARSGRAVVFPVYKGTYERRIPGQTAAGGLPGAALRRDLDIQRVKDARRALDYIATRPEIDSSRFGFSGISTGAHMGVLIAGVEPRLRAVVLAGAGLPQYRPPPEVDPFNFAPRVEAPVLMLSGRNDFVEDVETSQLPLFRLLGSPPGHKRHFLDDQGHVPARRDEVVRETLNWFDRYLGPVQPLE